MILLYHHSITSEMTILRRHTKEQHPSGIYLLPNLFTTSSLFAAFYSIVSSMDGHYEAAIIAIFIGMIADGLDGRIARLTNTQSEFGAQYDSLSDIVTFGVAPALLLYCWALRYLGKIGWLVAFLYVATVAIRLARFNARASVQDKRYFQGLPCPPAAACMCAFAWFCQQYMPSSMIVHTITGVFSIALALLMVSNIPYESFKDIDFKGKVPFLYLIAIILLFTAIAWNPSIVLLSGFFIYVLSGPCRGFWYRLRRARQ